MKHRNFFLVMVCSLLALGLAAAPSISAAPPEKIKVGATIPLTGRQAANGILLKHGYEFGVKHINEDGGIFIKEANKKIPVELVLYDDESDSTKAATRAATLYKQDKVDAFFGSQGPANYPLASIAEKNKIPIVMAFVSDTTLHEQGFKYLFSPFIKEHGFLTVFDVADDLAKRKGVKRLTKVALVLSKFPAAIRLSKMLAKGAPERGFEVVVREHYPFGSRDFSSIVLKAKSADAQIWFSLPLPHEGIAMMRQMKELDYSPDLIAMPLAASSMGWPGKAGAVGEFVGNPQIWHSSLKYPGNKRFVDDYKAKYGHVPWVDAGCAYIVAQVLFDGIKRAGSLNKDKVRDALAATDMVTVGGPMKFKPDGSPENINIMFNQWLNGVYEIVWPQKIATAEAGFPFPKWKDRK